MVGHFLGWGRGEPNGDRAWTTQEETDINDCVMGGLARFYFPAPLEGETTAHDWSFLKPVRELTLAADESTLALPADFGGIEGDITLSASDAQSFCPIKVVGVGQVYAQHSRFSLTTGQPQIVCVEPLRGTGQFKGQRFQLKVWPIADQAYTLQVQYYLLAGTLSNQHPYPYGGASHADTIKAACLSAAEEFLDDARGVRWTAFQERLASSIATDRKSKPQSLGRNRDRSDDMASYRRYWNFPNPITVGGVEY